MSFRSTLLKIKEWGNANRQNLVIGSFLALGFMTGLGIGLLVNQGGPAAIVIDKNIKTVILPSGDYGPEMAGAAGGDFVASINGQAYYPKNCAAAGRIKKENRVWFNSAAEAEMQGYKLAQNCR